MPTLPNLPPQAQAKFALVNNSLRQVNKANPKDQITTEFGDVKQADFMPQAKAGRWGTAEDNNECNISLRAPVDPTATVEMVGEKIKYKSKGYEVHLYDKPEASEDGGFEIELHYETIADLLKHATVVGDNYRIVLTTQWKGVVGYKQPPLTQEEIDEGAQRPENVINSIAFYHDSKGGMNDAAGMEYKVGKVGHFFRPKLIDNNGNETWGDQNWLPETNELEYLFPKDIVDKASFPIRI